MMGKVSVSPAHRPSPQAKVAALSQPDAYRPRPSHVEVIETHMAWVFLTDRHAWKLKKPVKRSFLDFSSVARRHRDGQEEVRWNRRLAPWTYLQVVPLTRASTGQLQVAGEGEIVDWLVQMRRLPSDRSLQALGQAGRLSWSELRPVTRWLAHFYQRANVAPISGARYPDHLLATVRANARAFAAIDPQPSLPPLPRLLAQQVHYISSHRPLLEARARQRHVIDAHGDLRPEHLFLVDPPEIIDCIAFNRRFRFLDTASELAFLGLECERAGMGWVMPAFWASYQDVTGDRPPPGLLRFYRQWHACTRAKIALWHLEDDDSDAPRWVGKARRYLQLAAGAAGR